MEAKTDDTTMTLSSSQNRRTQMDSPAPSEARPLERVYQEASQWVRLVNTIIWSMGTLLVPVSIGLVGVALNKSPGLQFDSRGKIVLGVGSVFLFGFWVYASHIYKKSVEVARAVLIKIEQKWMTAAEEKKLRLYEEQQKILDKQFLWFLPYGLFKSQVVTLMALIVVWLLIIFWPL
jgi:hypothetical protein